MDTRPEYLELILKSEGDTSPFESAWIVPQVLKVDKAFPKWFLARTSPTTAFVLAAHEDFRSLVTPTNPARRGEVIHVYGTAFGEVTTPPNTGQPSPSNPLARVVGEVRCWLKGPIDVLFAGLAPGLVGVYQIDLQIPRSAPSPDADLSCVVVGTESVTISRIAIAP